MRKNFIYVIALFLFMAAASNGELTSREFHANLSAGNQTRLTESPAVGQADFHLDLTDLTLTDRYRL